MSKFMSFVGKVGLAVVAFELAAAVGKGYMLSAVGQVNPELAGTMRKGLEDNLNTDRYPCFNRVLGKVICKAYDFKESCRKDPEETITDKDLA